jgi:hypothetical protein
MLQIDENGQAFLEGHGGDLGLGHLVAQTVRHRGQSHGVKFFNRLLKHGSVSSMEGSGWVEVGVMAGPVVADGLADRPTGFEQVFDEAGGSDPGVGGLQS